MPGVPCVGDGFAHQLLQLGILFVGARRAADDEADGFPVIEIFLDVFGELVLGRQAGDPPEAAGGECGVLAFGVEGEDVFALAEDTDRMCRLAFPGGADECPVHARCPWWGEFDGAAPPFGGGALEFAGGPQQVIVPFEPDGVDAQRLAGDLD